MEGTGWVNRVDYLIEGFPSTTARGNVMVGWQYRAEAHTGTSAKDRVLMER